MKTRQGWNLFQEKLNEIKGFEMVLFQERKKNRKRKIKKLN